MTRHWIRVAIAVAVLVSPVAADKKSDALRARLNSEFVGKSYSTKILLGSFWSYFDSSVQRNCTRLIDTEFSSDGSIKYLARHGCLEISLSMLPSASYIRPDVITGVQKPGTTVWVRKIDLKDDRIEFLLSTQPNSNAFATYAKIKFMLGRGYQDWEYKVLVGVFARALRIESFERLLTLEADVAALKDKLPTAEASYHAATGPASAKLKAARDLRDLLAKLAQNQSAYSAAGGTRADSADYLGRAKSLDVEIASLEAEAKKEEVAKLRVRLQANISEATQIKAVLRKEPPAPATVTEWQRRSEALARYQRVLQEREILCSDLQAAGEPVPETDLEKLNQEEQEATHYGEALERDRQRAQLGEVNSEYREMGRRRVQLLDAYTKAFGTPQERPALQALIAHLRRMSENRRTASKLGSATAANEAAQIEREIDKLSRR